MTPPTRTGAVDTALHMGDTALHMGKDAAEAAAGAVGHSVAVVGHSAAVVARTASKGATDIFAALHEEATKRARSPSAAVL